MFNLSLNNVFQAHNVHFECMNYIIYKEKEEKEGER